ncbi:manganese efflux pump MntP family protein [Xanthomonas campestris pv. badrii]|uniref:Putative manganese efflux pump MntP n=1 Tax=Xanthomonas campestris pv. badrii TaxID=149696 RepID=A0A7Z2VDI0_XANCA|nr:manganese efflux pump MntP family protein [Xanthomonas campestris]MCC4604488.1 manganese efflux pump MntP family protein [Xanthomonas campestris pv. parthenii]QJD69412.1 manganese efflux pump MntP family protein [Xanthomonas campestris pv. badrii]
MSPYSIVLIGFAMSTDAFAAAIGKGAAMRKPQWRDALRAGVIFGCIEAITPVIGWLLGRAASSHLQSFDHWIAFGLLSVLGMHMIVAGLRTDPDPADEQDATPKKNGLLALAATGFATSIDAMAVGVSLAFLDVHIGAVAVVVGLCTFSMVTAGIMLGRAVGALIGKRAEILGGLILVIVGSVILYQHLSGAA